MLYSNTVVLYLTVPYNNTFQPSLGTGIPCEEYQLPFYEKVQSDPSIEEMKMTVCVEKYRPSIPSKWSKNEVIY